MTFPLADTRTTGIGHNHSTYRFEISYHAITLSSTIDLFRTRVDNQPGSHLQTFRLDLTCQGGCTTQILVRRIGAGTNQSHFHFLRIAILFYLLRKFRNRASRIGSKRSVDIRFQSRQVDFYYPVIIKMRSSFHFLVRSQTRSIFRSHFCHFLTSGSTQIFLHLCIIRKDRGSSSHFCSHIANSGLTGSRQ